MGGVSFDFLYVEREKEWSDIVLRSDGEYDLVREKALKARRKKRTSESTARNLQKVTKPKHVKFAIRAPRKESKKYIPQKYDSKESTYSHN
jgi:hypothetical protein